MAITVRRGEEQLQDEADDGLEVQTPPPQPSENFQACQDCLLAASQIHQRPISESVCTSMVEKEH